MSCGFEGVGRLAITDIVKSAAMLEQEGAPTPVYARLTRRPRQQPPHRYSRPGATARRDTSIVRQLPRDLT
jgi:hypothetical protein